MDKIDKKALIYKHHSRGVASLPTILVVVILILIVAISVAALAMNESSSSASQANTVTAKEYAKAGARDALEQVAINKDYFTPTSTPYTISFVTNGCTNNNGCATVSVSSNVGSQADPKIITSIGTVGNNSIEVQVSVILDSSLYGQIATTTWQEKSLSL
jgi:Tfp pilus assembly protein PilX